MSNELSLYLIDDDVDDVELFGEVISEIGLPVRFMSAKNGVDALQKLTSENAIIPDLIFLDLNMPKMGGRECLRELKKDRLLRDIPVIVYTTSFHASEVEESLKEGAICFITKPSDLKELKKILRDIALSLPDNLEQTLRALSKDKKFFIAHK